MPSHIREPAPGHIAPIQYARRLALAKAQAVRARTPRAMHGTPVDKRWLRTRSRWILAADTIVVVGGKILGKPATLAQAQGMLRRLSGSTHRVITAVALLEASSGRARVRHAVSRVTMRPLTEPEIRRFARKHRDKAGGYAVQDRRETIVTAIQGSHSNVVGLPKHLVLDLLHWAHKTQ